MGIETDSQISTPKLLVRVTSVDLVPIPRTSATIIVPPRDPTFGLIPWNLGSRVMPTVAN